MALNIETIRSFSMIEAYRKAAVEAAMSTSSASHSFPHWSKSISTISGGRLSGRVIFDLGDHLRDIFKASSQGNLRVGENTNSSDLLVWESLLISIITTTPNCFIFY